MAPWLAQDSLLSSQLDNSNGSLLKELQENNKDELTKLDEKIKDAQDNLGETELSDALRNKASYLAKIGEKVRTLQTIMSPFFVLSFAPPYHNMAGM